MSQFLLFANILMTKKHIFSSNQVGRYSGKKFTENVLLEFDTSNNFNI